MPSARAGWAQRPSQGEYDGGAGRRGSGAKSPGACTATRQVERRQPQGVPLLLPAQRPRSTPASDPVISRSLSAPILARIDAPVDGMGQSTPEAASPAWRRAQAPRSRSSTAACISQSASYPGRRPSPWRPDRARSARRPTSPSRAPPAPPAGPQLAPATKTPEATVGGQRPLSSTCSTSSCNAIGIAAAVLGQPPHRRRVHRHP